MRHTATNSCWANKPPLRAERSKELTYSREVFCHHVSERRTTGPFTHRQTVPEPQRQIKKYPQYEREKQSEGGEKIASELSEADRMAKRRRKGCER